MSIFNVNADEGLWTTNMLPEGVLERWFVTDGATAEQGHRIAEVRIEDALHEIIAPATGRLSVYVPALNIIEPGRLLATVEVSDSLGEFLAGEIP